MAEATIERRSTWIDGDLIQQAKTIAAHDDVPIAEVLERHLRPGLAADLQRVAAELTKRPAKAAT